MEGDSGHTARKPLGGLDVIYIKDFPFPSNARFTKENILSALSYKPLDDDLIVSSYPKTGTTWVEYIMLQILHRGEKFPTMVELNHKLIPFMERTGAAAAEKMDPPRLIKFHMPFHLIPYNKKARYIYVVRNPKDVAVSYYHFRRSMGDDDVSFEDFFEYFMSGEIPFGDYLQHMASWIRNKKDNVFIICYEKLHKDRRNEILRIAKFLGEDHFEALKADSELLSKIISTTNFDHMMKNLALTRPPLVPNLDDTNAAGDEKKTVKFFRKGQPGDWKNHLSSEQCSRLDNKMREVLGEGELLDLWLS